LTSSQKILVAESLTIEKSDLHQEFGTNFSYIDHYQKDAELFSYNEDKTPAIIKDESINCIIASEIIEHVPDPKKFISGLLRILTSNGKLIITTPYDEKFEYYLCVHCNKPTPKSALLHSFNEINIIQYVPGEALIWSSKKFINKYLIKIRSHIILKSLPYKYWELIDNLFNKLVNKPTRLKVIIKKKQRLLK
jgi:2-polyprenyl-3-methyl-5-hydroxy-6-metoxy-1,4-benzoquinol methylase